MCLNAILHAILYKIDTNQEAVLINLCGSALGSPVTESYLVEREFGLSIAINAILTATLSFSQIDAYMNFNLQMVFMMI